MEDNKYLEIPWQSLSEDVLNGIIKEFVLQEGTEYGSTEYGSVEHSLENKIERVRKQVEKGQAKLYFDAETETCFLGAPTSVGF